MTEQIAQVIFIQTPRRKQATAIAGMKYQFITVIESYLFGNAIENIAGETFLVTDREKTLINCASRPNLSGGILQLAQALRNSYNQINWKKLDKYLQQWGGTTV
jgi:predicted transcriptional regulator of viral defense system